MRYEIVLSRQAQRELNEAADWLAERAGNPAIAEKWFTGFLQTLSSLEQMPQRCGLAREDRHFSTELRQILYGRRQKYRAIFTIQEKRVVVLTIRRGAMSDLQPSDLED
ncbi:type II toxin-antitoxin system RelE/ParE family toxin [Blastopirellula marina]|uniref:Type II toxin-antitoxin system RelE/ParE family toxin n=1 Tax=Blastopirellula marina TaxID=124 RepID=A0A2S8GFK1_9BACT|nr:type II toxin-antitoxin system RelE/ParE family toxin [Blastopirellula marina]PQO43236.1 type II toxin-antitoxin system RelE/ParE family toxin [Blastopirellula marina]